eukprot:TRINITY_DN2804_c0_g2_i1.p1 TRINITY_DN2804_c0_g2~~TRINITY_DN2804_c0_g2_i1.p1  ORF type:complete len:779 (+),score=215.91 TRINITY_DN2804_c0_g2_i1:129-2465(+)
MIFEDLSSLQKVNYLAVLPNALKFADDINRRTIELVNFLDRNRAYELIVRTWSAWLEAENQKLASNNELAPAAAPANRNKGDVRVAVDAMQVGKKEQQGRGHLIISGMRTVLVANSVKKKQGFLVKKANILGQWKTRWVVLSDKTLSYYERKDTEALNTVPLNQVSSVREDESAPQPNAFNVVMADRMLSFSAPSPEERTLWVQAIEECRVALQQRYYYGVWMVEDPSSISSVLNIEWRVLEIDFFVRSLRLLNKGRPVLNLPFNRIQSCTPDLQHHLHFTILTHVSNEKYELYCQSPRERDRIAEIINRINRRNRRLLDQLLLLQHNLQSPLQQQQEKADNILRDLFATVDVDGDGTLSIDELMNAMKEEENTDIESELQQSIHRSRPLFQDAVFYHGKSVWVSRYMLLEQRPEGSRLLVFRNEAAINPLKVVSLYRATLFPAGDDTFAVQTNCRNRPFLFRASSPENRQMWVRLCMRAVEEEENAGRVARQPSVRQPSLFVSPSGSTAPTSVSSLVMPSSPLPASLRSAVPLQRLNHSSNLRSPSNVAWDAELVPGAPQSLASSFPGMRAVEEDSKVMLLLEEKDAELAASKQTEVALRQEVADFKARLEEEKQAKRLAEDQILNLQMKYQKDLALFQSKMEAAENQALQLGAMFLKHVKNGSPHPRFVYLTPENDRICWVEDPAKRKNVKDIVLAEVTNLFKGYRTAVFRTKYALTENEECCMSIVTADRSLDVQCPDPSCRDLWFNVISRLVEAAKFQRALPDEFKSETPTQNA